MTITEPAPLLAPTTSRLLGAAADGLAEHDRRNGPLPLLPRPEALEALLRDAGLLGHGGAAFPAWRKLAAVTGDRRRAVVVGNAAEGEPASRKDRTLLETAPHLVLDGLALVAAATRAGDAYLYVAEDALPAATRAVRERDRVRRDGVRVSVVAAPDLFVAGEESAVVSRLSGGPALPRDKFTMVVESGVHGRPTVVHNIETLAHIALVARHGSRWFREVGTDEDPGTFLSTVSGAVAAPGVHEAPYGVPLGELVARAGGPSTPLQAVLVGGYHGAWLPWPDAAGLPMTRAALRPYGAAPGAGVVVALADGACGLLTTSRLVDYLAGQSAAQCGPCMFGLPRLATVLRALANGPHARIPAETAAEVERLSGEVDGRGACKHPDGTVRLVRSAMATFREDVSAHRSGRCLHEDLGWGAR
jgi:NADH:ubiquinone oxidoreductase subunit F (NADH-binding)